MFFDLSFSAVWVSIRDGEQSPQNGEHGVSSPKPKVRWRWKTGIIFCCFSPENDSGVCWMMSRQKRYLCYFIPYLLVWSAVNMTHFTEPNIDHQGSQPTQNQSKNSTKGVFNTKVQQPNNYVGNITNLNHLIVYRSMAYCLTGDSNHYSSLMTFFVIYSVVYCREVNHKLIGYTLAGVLLLWTSEFRKSNNTAKGGLCSLKTLHKLMSVSTTRYKHGLSTDFVLGFSVWVSIICLPSQMSNVNRLCYHTISNIHAQLVITITKFVGTSTILHLKQVHKNFAIDLYCFNCSLFIRTGSNLFFLRNTRLLFCTRCTQDKEILSRLQKIARILVPYLQVIIRLFSKLPYKILSPSLMIDFCIELSCNFKTGSFYYIYKMQLAVNENNTRPYRLSSNSRITSSGVSVGPHKFSNYDIIYFALILIYVIRIFCLLINEVS